MVTARRRAGRISGLAILPDRKKETEK